MTKIRFSSDVVSDEKMKSKIEIIWSLLKKKKQNQIWNGFNKRRPVVDVIKLFGRNLEIKKVFSDVWTCTKMWKLFSETVYCFFIGLVCCFS